MISTNNYGPEKDRLGLARGVDLAFNELVRFQKTKIKRNRDLSRWTRHNMPRALRFLYGLAKTISICYGSVG